MVRSLMKLATKDDEKRTSLPFAVSHSIMERETDLFSMGAIGLALKHIEVFSSSGAVFGTLQNFYIKEKYINMSIE